MTSTEQKIIELYLDPSVSATYITRKYGFSRVYSVLDSNGIPRRGEKTGVFYTPGETGATPTNTINAPKTKPLQAVITSKEDVPVGGRLTNLPAGYSGGKVVSRLGLPSGWWEYRALCFA